MNDSPDDELMARLRAADPLPDLPALRPERLDQLLEDTVTTTAAAPTTRRPRALLLAAAAAGVVAVGGGALYLTTAEGGTTVLTTAPGGGPAASCAALTPEGLAGSDLAFAGRVTGISGGTVTLEMTQRYAGDVDDTVEVTQGDAGVVVDGAPIVFEEGASYLLVADDGTIGSCSGSGPDTPELRSLFDEAFGG